MKQRPILMSGPLVRAILEGKKTQTRRPIKTELNARGLRWGFKGWEDYHGNWVKCPYGTPGDHLWVRETWQNTEGNRFIYKADPIIWGGKWKPAIFMPREACRLVLEIEDIRVQGLWDISEEDAKAEGVEPTEEIRGESYAYRAAFIEKWIEIYGIESHKSNPWVWVINFNTL